MKSYTFNYTGDPLLPKWGEEEILENVFVKIEKLKHRLLYFIDACIETNSIKKIVSVQQDVIILLLSTINPAHSISEIISFINYCAKKENHIAISEYFIKNLKFMYELITLFFPQEKIIILSNDHIYKFKKLYTFRNQHFNYTKQWESVPFQIENNTLSFKNIQYIKNNFLIDSQFLFDKVEEIYNSFKYKYNLFENIMLIKFEDELSTTPTRGLQILSEEIKTSLSKNNIQVISHKDFDNILHYICVIYHAKNIIFSYGGPCCTNRFFCNPESNVIVLCNQSYKLEYDYRNEKKDYWHIRHSHLIPVKNQTFLLDFENHVDKNNMNKIIDLIYFSKKKEKKDVMTYVKSYSNLNKKIVYNFSLVSGGIGDLTKFFMYLLTLCIRNDIKLFYLINDASIEKYLKLKYNEMYITEETIHNNKLFVSSVNDVLNIETEKYYIVNPVIFHKIFTLYDDIPYSFEDVFCFSEKIILNSKQLFPKKDIATYNSIHLRLGDKYLETEKEYIQCIHDKRNYDEEKLFEFIENNRTSEIIFFCDNYDYKLKIKNKYPYIMITECKIGHTGLLNTLDKNIMDAVTEYYLMTNSAKIFSASYSGFSITAAKFKNIPLQKI